MRYGGDHLYNGRAVSCPCGDGLESGDGPGPLAVAQRPEGADSHGPDTFTEHGRDGFSTRFTITCRKANALWEFTLENENLTGTWRGEFRAVEDGTRVTFTERIQPRKWWMRLFARRYLQSQQRRYFEDLQRTLVNRAP